MNESLELVKIVETSGIEKQKQNLIVETLSMFFSKATEWDETIKNIIIVSPEEIDKMQQARDGRLFLKNMRLDADKIIKSKRDEVKYRMADDVLEDKLWLKAGQIMEATFKNLETKLEEKENFAKIWENNRKAELKQSRLQILIPYMEFVLSGIDLIDYNDEDFEKLLNGVKLQLQVKIENEKRIEEERIAIIKAEKEEQERIKLENERLKQEREVREKEIALEREKAEKARKEIELKAKQEREVREKLESELKAKQEKEQNELRLKQEQDNKLALAPDKEKLIEFAKMLDCLILPQLKIIKAQKILSEAKENLLKISNAIREKAIGLI